MANRASVHLFTGVPADTLVTLRQRFEAPANTLFVLWLLSQLRCSFNKKPQCLPLNSSLSTERCSHICAVLSQNTSLCFAPQWSLMHHSRLHPEKGIDVMFILQNNCKMLNMWYVSLLQSLGGRIAHHSQFFCQSAWKKQVLCFPHEREKWVTRSLENYCKVFCYCTVLDVTVSQEIPPIWLSGISNKSFAYVVSPLLGWFESSWSSKLNSLSFSGPPVFFFLQQCLTAPSVTLTVSPCAALFSHYLHALMVCNLSRRPICLLAHSTDTASLVSPHPRFPASECDW